MSNTMTILLSLACMAIAFYPVVIWPRKARR